MCDENTALKPSESVARVINVVTTATTADSGKYLWDHGETIP